MNFGKAKFKQRVREANASDDADELDMFSDNDDLYNDSVFSNDFGGDISEGMAPKDRYNDLLLQLTNFDDYIRELFNDWLGIVWDEEQKKWAKSPDLEPIMNIKCARWCITFLKTYTRKNNIITHIRDEHYRNIVESMIDTIWYNLGTRWKTEFGIKHKGDVLMIGAQLQDSAELALMGAGDGKYNKMLNSVVSRNETVALSDPNRRPQQNNQSVMDKAKSLIGLG